MFKYKKTKMIAFLSTTLILLCILLLLCDGDANNIMNTKTVASAQTVASKPKTDNAEQVIEKSTTEEDNTKEVIEKSTTEEDNTETIIETNEIEEEVIETEPKVYEGMTITELASKLERSMKNELSGHGYLYASYSLERGVDPYIALAISLEETGCNWNCSSLIKNCNNVGGMKGSGCGSYGYFNTLDDGIKAFIDNIANNYVAYGLTTADTMNPKYAENPMWSTNVNNYISIIRNN